MPFPDKGSSPSKTRPDHTERARQAWPILVQVAANRGRISYGQLCGPLGLHPRSASYFLSVIHNHCQARGWPPLVALAVNQQNAIPGAGYNAGPRAGKGYRETLEDVYTRDWPTTAPF